MDAALDALHHALYISLEAVLSALPALPEQDDDSALHDRDHGA
jgi:hypothetical protein